MGFLSLVRFSYCFLRQGFIMQLRPYNPGQPETYRNFPGLRLLSAGIGMSLHEWLYGLFYYYYNYHCVYVYVYGWLVPLHIYGRQRRTCENWFSLSTMLVLDIKLRSPACQTLSQLSHLPSLQHGLSEKNLISRQDLDTTKVEQTYH